MENHNFIWVNQHIWLVVWNMCYFSIWLGNVGNVMIPTDFHSFIFQRGRWLNHQPDGSHFTIACWIKSDGIFLHPKSWLKWLNPGKCWKATHGSSINQCIYILYYIYMIYDNGLHAISHAHCYIVDIIFCSMLND